MRNSDVQLVGVTDSLERSWNLSWRHFGLSCTGILVPAALPSRRPSPGHLTRRPHARPQRWSCFPDHFGGGI